MKINRTKIEALTGDITKVDFAEAIVNSSNEELFGEGGVNGAVHRAAGEQLRAACGKLGGCRPGDARITDAYNLSCKYIIHTVGPVWKDGRHREKRILESCYKNVLQIADSCGIRSLAFSSIGTGKKGFPKEKAAVTAVKTVTEYVREHPAAFDNISWILSDDETKQVYESALNMMEEVTRIKSQAKSPDLPVFRIGYKNRLVQVQMIKCLQEGHEVTPGNGIVTMLEKDGSRRMRAFNVGYCEQCQNHYILLSTAVSMKKQGVPMCRMLAKKDYEKEIGEAAGKVNPRTLMEQYGYTIFDLEYLSDIQRRIILATLVENKIISAASTAGYLGDLIMLGKKNPFYTVEDEDIEIWKSDKVFLSLYPVDEK